MGKHLAIDLMGSDTPPQLLYEGVVEAASLTSTLFTVLGTPSVLYKLPSHPQIRHLTTSNVIAMEDSPLHAIRKKKDSSLVVGLNLVKEKAVDGLISCGNTGALIAGAVLVLKLQEGIERPALIAPLPTSVGSMAVLDVGGNVDVTPQHLLQFAKMGKDYLQNRQKRGEGPFRVGLLNIGVESEKGTKLIREAYSLIKEHCDTDPQLVFVGNVEGRDTFNSRLDLLVTDGFTGNVFLKTAEGATRMTIEAMEKEGSGLSPALVEKLDYQNHPGALLYGVKGTVVKCHGNTTPTGLVKTVLNCI